MFQVRYGLGGGFGGCCEWEDCDAENEEQAMHYAWEAACDVYESYAGLHGLRSIEDIMEEENIDNWDDANEVYCDERESWLDYEIREIK